MDRLGFKQWLEYMDRLATAPSGAGEIWHSNREFDRRGVRSPNIAPDGEIEEPHHVDPEKLFGKKKCKKRPKSINKEGL